MLPVEYLFSIPVPERLDHGLNITQCVNNGKRYFWENRGPGLQPNFLTTELTEEDQRSQRIIFLTMDILQHRAEGPEFNYMPYMVYMVEKASVPSAFSLVFEIICVICGQIGS